MKFEREIKILIEKYNNANIQNTCSNTISICFWLLVPLQNGWKNISSYHQLYQHRYTYIPSIFIASSDIS